MDLQELASRFRDLIERGSFSGSLSNGWSLGAAGYFVGIVIYVIAVVFIQIANVSGFAFAGSLYELLGRNLVVACPALITCLNLAIRAVEHSENPRSEAMAGWTIAGCALLGPVLAVGVLIGAIGALASGGGAGPVLVAFVIQLAGFVVAIVATLWAVSQVPVRETKVHRTQ